MKHQAHCTSVNSLKALWIKIFKGLGPTVLITLFFATLALLYFSPAILEGRELYQHDVAGASGTAQDVRDHYEKTGEVSYWTNSLFSGMPMYQIAPSYPSLRAIKAIQDFLTLQAPFKFLPSYSWLLFAMLLGFYILMRSLKQGRALSVLGSLMWCFSSYFIILIDAGHIWKLMTLSFIPPTIAGIIYSYRGQYLKGGIITAFFATLQLMSNHIQMSYYFAFVTVFILLAYLYESIQQKSYKRFLYATLSTLVAGIIAIAINGSNIYHTYEYSRETMRGGSALSQPTGQGATREGGLDKAYITAWSYGKAETLTFLVPNLYGGSSGYLGHNPDALTHIEDPNIRQVVAGMGHYWGDQPFTSGPVYVGAFVLFLAVLALFIVRTPLKWALLAGTLLSLLLSWGHNLMWFSDLFIDYFPLYNKFRTVSSILVLAEFCIPILAILGLLEFLSRPQGIIQKERSALILSLFCTLGVTLSLALVPGIFFDFISGQEQELFRQHLGNPQVIQILSALKTVRSSIVSADAWRSAFVITLGLVLCWLYYKHLLSKRLLTLALGLLILGDLWLVNKRYLNDEKFIDTTEIEARAKPVTDIDLKIQQDTDPHYRVLNLSVSTFNDATTSYAHRSIGGYHAAKLGRYQDLIERQITERNQQVLNMLDMRYIISRGADNRLSYQRNEGAMGAAWLIDPRQVYIVSTADEEMDALKHLDLRYQAVVNRDQSWDAPFGKELNNDKASSLTNLSNDRLITRVENALNQKKGADDTDQDDSVLASSSLGSVRLLSYTPKQACYEVEAKQEALLVFSEVYYPKGWQLKIDNQVAEIKRANYLLRATKIAAGKHTIEMSFEPESIRISERISYIAQILLLGAMLFWGYRNIKRKNIITR